MNKQARLFLSYSHKDEAYKNELTTQLAGLKRAGYIESWDDRKILPGQQWNDEIAKGMQNADVFLFLVSADFIASGYIYDVEIKTAKEKAADGKAAIVPVIIRPCDFENSSLSEFQALPKNGQPVDTFPNRDEAWMNVINELKRIIAGKEPTPSSGNWQPQTGLTREPNKPGYLKIAIIVFIVLLVSILAILKFSGRETTGIKGNNNDNNEIQIGK